MLQHMSRAVAVKDAGDVAAAFFDGANGNVYWSGNGGELKLVAVAGEISAVTFLRGQAGIVVADRLHDEVSLVSDLSTNPSSVRLANEADEVSGPAAIEISKDGSKAFIANENSGAVVIIDLAGGT